MNDEFKRFWTTRVPAWKRKKITPRKRSNKPVPTTWNGVTHTSRRESAIYWGIPENTLKLWLRKGYTCDDEVPQKNNVQPHSVPTLWNGVLYSSLHEASRQSGIPLTTLYRYKKQGYTCDDDLKQNKS